MTSHKQPLVWVIDDDRSIRWVLEKAMQQADIEARCFSDAGVILKALSQNQPDAIITDIRMPGMNGIELLQQITKYYPDLPVIVMTAYSDLDSAVLAYDGGAFEYLPKPFDIDEAIDLVRRACAHGKEKKTLADDADKRVFSSEIIGEAPAMQGVFRLIGRLARSHITILINGESGTGKELVAHALHRHSPRAHKPFIALNMAAIPRDLLESELFGHERGAFTGAQQRRIGRFEQANLGTLFLDEIGDMPAELQTRLLRVLSDGEFYTVGGHTPTKVNVRIIAATHQNLEFLVQQGTFREDLFHRINVIRIRIPPLRDRREDIPLLMQYFLPLVADELGVKTKTLLKDTEAFLCQLPWAGNVRQLENVCRWITVMASGQRVHIDDLPPDIKNQLAPAPDQAQDWESALKAMVATRLVAGQTNLLAEIGSRFERVMITTVLAHTAGRKQDAAALLGWGRNTLTRKMKELGM